LDSCLHRRTGVTAHHRGRGIAILFLGNTLSEFTKVLPSTGGFISFIGKPSVAELE